MSKYEAYRERVGASGTSVQDAVISTTKRQTVNFIMKSPSLKYVLLNDETEGKPCIVSDKESFNKRVFLFLPDTEINVGDYIHYDTFTYLATNRKRDNLYPELTGEVCNDMYKVLIGQTKVTIGRDDFNRPIYDYISESRDVPCVMTTKTYSTADNSAIPLPDGAMIVKLPYLEGVYPKVNDEFKHRSGSYQVTDVSYENVINEVGYVEIRLALEVDK